MVKNCIDFIEKYVHYMWYSILQGYIKLLERQFLNIIARFLNQKNQKTFF